MNTTRKEVLESLLDEISDLHPEYIVPYIKDQIDIEINGI